MSAPAGPELIVAGFVLILLVALVVLRPLLSPGEEAAGADDERRAALEAAKEAKYREIRDAELDFRMGKLSEEDYRTTDRELRAQAIAILREIDSLEGADPDSLDGGEPPRSSSGGR